MRELTESEAAERAALIEAVSYQLVLDLTAEPVTSRTEVRFRCRAPGAETFADVRLATVREATLNGERLSGPADGRLPLTGLRAENVLTVEGDVPDGPALTWFEDPADGGRYVYANVFPANSAELMACFDQLDLPATVSLELHAPPDWECYANGPVAQRSRSGDAGRWQFAPVPGFMLYLLCFAAGPFAVSPDGVSSRPSVPGAAFPQFAAAARRSLEHYAQVLAVPSPDPKYDIIFIPGLNALAMSVPGLMLVNETLLARMTDPDDDFTAMVCLDEVAHVWFGSLVTPRWWDDLWLDEAMATYLAADTDPAEWVAFGYRDKAGAYQADRLPGSVPVSSPVADATHALDRPYALTYIKGASIVRQVAALIGDDALYASLTDYLTRFAHRGGTLDDLAGCWSRASGRDLSGWADQWLRSTGAPLLRPSLAVSPDGVIESFSVTQDRPRTHRIGIGLYDLAGDGLVRRESSPACELAEERTVVPELAGQPMPDAIVLNDGDLSYARVRFDDVSLRVLTSAAMRVDDPLTEAVGWNAAWDMVTSAELPAITFVDMACRRIRAGELSVAAAETLTSRAIACAGTWAPAGVRAALREEIAEACIFSERAVLLPSVRRALAAGFAAAAQTEDQLGLLRSWLKGDVDADLRAKATVTLAARGLATDDDLAALVALDPVNGERNRATAAAMRPDPAAKKTAWQAALAPAGPLAREHASGIWVPGQEELMAGYRDRYFAEALPLLTAPGPRSRQRKLVLRLLFPSTLISPATVEACSGFEDDVIIAEQAAIMRQVLAARAR